MSELIRRHQFHHVAAESVNTSCGPETQDIKHFARRARVIPVHFPRIGPVTVVPAENRNGAYVIGGDMIGDEIYQAFHSAVMSPSHHGLELVDAGCRIDGQIGIDVEPIRHRVGRPRVTLDEILASSVTWNAGKPDIINPKGAKIAERRFIPVGEPSAAPQPRQNLINYLLSLHQNG